MDDESWESPVNHKAMLGTTSEQDSGGNWDFCQLARFRRRAKAGDVDDGKSPVRTCRELVPAKAGSRQLRPAVSHVPTRLKPLLLLVLIIHHLSSPRIQLSLLQYSKSDRFHQQVLHLINLPQRQMTFF
jgi:hypothetical protein